MDFPTPGTCIIIPDNDQSNLQAILSVALWFITTQDIQTSLEVTPQVPLLMMMTQISQVTTSLLTMTLTTNQILSMSLQTCLSNWQVLFKASLVPLITALLPTLPPALKSESPISLTGVIPENSGFSLCNANWTSRSALRLSVPTVTIVLFFLCISLIYWLAFILLPFFAPFLRNAFNLHIASLLHAMHGPIILFPLFLLQTSSLVHAWLITQPLSLLSQWPVSSYIRLSSLTRNTVWSMRRVSIYLSRQHFLYFSQLESTWLFFVKGISLNLCATLECAFLCLNLPLNSLKQPIVARSCCGSPQHPWLLKSPSRKPLALGLSSLCLPLSESSITKDSSSSCRSHYCYSLPPLPNNPLMILVGSYRDHENPRPLTHHQKLLTWTPKKKKPLTPTPLF